MVALAMSHRSSVAEVAREAAASLTSVRHWGDSSFINLPLVYPGGGFVTVKLDQAGTDKIKVSDNGFAFREIESIGAERSFTKTANTLLEPFNVEIDRRTVFAVVPIDAVERAICDVAMASWQIADRIYTRVAEEDEDEIEEHLKGRLSSIFGSDKVEMDCKLIGSSTSEWEMSSVVRLPNRTAVFHAVSNHAYSVFRASTAFRDLALLEKPPSLTAVVRSKKVLGPRYGILAQAGGVIEENQEDAVYLKAA